MKNQIMKTALVIGTILAAQAQAAEYTLRFSHFFPAASSFDINLAQVWAEKVEKDSNGRIEVDVYPAGTLSKPTAQYDAVVNRIADLTLTVQGYTANRFPLTQIVELPGVSKSAVNGSCIVQGLYDEGLTEKEYKKTHPLFMFTHGPGNIHTSEKLIKTPEDLQGLRIRRPTAVVAKLLEGLDAQPVGMPAPGAYEALQRGVIDGVTLPWAGQKAFRLNELTAKHTEVGGLYTLAFLVTMNKSVYNQMPKDLQQVIDNNSGAEWSNLGAKIFEDLDITGRQQAKDLGQEIYVVEDGIENAAWKPILDKAKEEYIASLEKKRLPARKVYARALELGESCPI